MAITRTLLTYGSDASATSVNTASISPGANKLIVVDVHNSSYGTAGTIALSGCGMTWVSVETVTHDGGATRQRQFRGMSASPSSGALTISSLSNNGVQWQVHEYDGIDTGGTNGSAAIVQAVTNSTTGGDPNGLTITLAALGDATNNAVHAAFGVGEDGLQTPSTGYTEIYDDNTLTSSQDIGFMSMWKLPGTTTPGASGQSAFRDISGIAIEIKAGSTATTHTASGTLAGSAGTVSGTATHYTKHTGSGSLSGGAGTVSGTAAHYTLHSSSGALSGGAGTLAGTATHLTLHSASGALSGSAGEISGTAARWHAFSASGTLVGSSGVIEGSATLTTGGEHSASGVLSGPSGLIEGAAAHYTLHTVSGGLSGPAGVVAGTSAHSGAGAIRGGLIRRTKERRILIVIDGKRYLIPESEVQRWVQDKTEEIVENALKPVPVKKLKKLKKQRQEKIPEISTKSDDSWVRELVQSANRAVAFEIEQRKLEEEELELLLLVA